MEIVAAVFAGKAAQEIVVKVLGPTADYLGQGLLGWTKRRRDNTENIFLNAGAKLGDRINEPGRVPPKVLKEILDDGSFAEDELAADYFGGVLASSRAGVDRDDRGATLAKLVAQLSVYQLRTHYFIYSEIKRLYDGEACELGTIGGRRRLRLFISDEAFESALEIEAEEEYDNLAARATHGLMRNDLIYASEFIMGDHELMKSEFENAPSGGLIVMPSMFGAELFLWAQGLGQVWPTHLLDSNVKLLSDISLPIKGLVIPLARGDAEQPVKSQEQRVLLSG